MIIQALLQLTATTKCCYYHKRYTGKLMLIMFLLIMPFQHIIAALVAQLSKASSLQLSGASSLHSTGYGLRAIKSDF